MTTAQPINMVSAAIAEPPTLPPSYSTITLPLPPTSNQKTGNKSSTSAYQEIKNDTAGSSVERTTSQNSEDDPTSYIRDPHKLVCYLIPFPTPAEADDDKYPIRFLVYTPPPPPMLKPGKGEKDSVKDKVQRRWQREVREARTNNAKLLSYKGVKGRFVKGHDWAFSKVTSADLEFVNRIPTAKVAKGKSGGKNSLPLPDTGEGEDDDELVVDEVEEEETSRTIKLEEMVLVYPPSLGLTEDEIRTEFMGSLMRTKSKAQRDAWISTGLLPLSLCADAVLAHVGGPGGFTQVNGVWSALTIRGARNARSITKRLASSTHSGDLATSTDADHLQLKFRQSDRVDVMRDYLASLCTARNDNLFATSDSDEEVEKTSPLEGDVLEAIGWKPSGQTTNEFEERNWEDEAWEQQHVEYDMRDIMKKAAKNWESWCKLHAKHPKRALKK
ncbi:MAG: hypothetical protein TREMPRED_003986 [Tremellales sp. Tagirdzhanova-0007]|nr:MAG: hypothetical protein TREMPRED_003986 [Tremellales sp. Tagirdzhanova-0007]